MKIKSFIEKIRSHVMTSIKAQPKIEIDFDTYDRPLRAPLRELWAKFEQEFGEHFQDVSFSKYSDQMQKKATLDIEGLKVYVEGPRVDNPDYEPSRGPSRTPQEQSDNTISQWLSNSYVFDNASPRKLRTLLTVVKDALEYDTMVKPDVELINAVNRLTLSLHKRNTNKPPEEG